MVNFIPSFVSKIRTNVVTWPMVCLIRSHCPAAQFSSSLIVLLFMMTMLLPATKPQNNQILKRWWWCTNERQCEQHCSNVEENTKESCHENKMRSSCAAASWQSAKDNQSENFINHCQETEPIQIWFAEFQPSFLVLQNKHSFRWSAGCCLLTFNISCLQKTKILLGLKRHCSRVLQNGKQIVIDQLLGCLWSVKQSHPLDCAAKVVVHLITMWQWISWHAMDFFAMWCIRMFKIFFHCHPAGHHS